MNPPTALHEEESSEILKLLRSIDQQLGTGLDPNGIVSKYKPDNGERKDKRSEVFWRYENTWSGPPALDKKAKGSYKITDVCFL